MNLIEFLIAGVITTVKLQQNYKAGGLVGAMLPFLVSMRFLSEDRCRKNEFRFSQKFTFCVDCRKL